ncbi:MAG: phage tail fiber protein [Anaerolineae bacterium]
MRVLVNRNGGSSPTWDLAAAGLVENTHLIQFPQATASWGTVVGVAICSAATLGDLLWYDNDMVDQGVGTGDTIEFPIGTLDLQMS